MENQTLEINVTSATDLNKISLISKMDVYVVVFIDGAGKQNKQKKKTPVNNNGDTSPSWDYSPLTFTVDEIAARQDRLTLVFKIRCERALGLGDGEIGEVRVPVRELLDSPADTNKKIQFANYQVSKPNGQHKGELTFSYKLVDQTSTAHMAGPDSSYPLPSSYPSTAMEIGSYPLLTGHNSAYSPPLIYTTTAVATGSYPLMTDPNSAYPTPSIFTPTTGSHHPQTDPTSAYSPPSNYTTTAAAIASYPPMTDPNCAYIYPIPAPIGYPQTAPSPPQDAYPTSPQGPYGYGHPYPLLYGGYPPMPPVNGYGYAPPPGYGYQHV